MLRAGVVRAGNMSKKFGEFRLQQHMTSFIHSKGLQVHPCAPSVDTHACDRLLHISAV